jgi:hypothetical protein
MLHTSFVFVTVEPIIKDLFAELLPDVKVIDFVDSDVLATVQREGTVSANSVRRMCHLAEAADDAGVDLIFSACSSLGPAIDVARPLVRVPIVKVDDAMARDAVSRAERIGVLASGGYYRGTDEIGGIVEEAASYVAMGFRAMKMKVGGMPIEGDAERVAAVRAAFPELDLMLDANSAYSVPDAIRAARVFEPMRVLWFEEPTHWYDSGPASKIGPEVSRRTYFSLRRDRANGPRASVYEPPEPNAIG